jgi:hypothetical protein
MLALILVAALYIGLWDWDRFGDPDFLGEAVIPFEELEAWQTVSSPVQCKATPILHPFVSRNHILS